MAVKQAEAQATTDAVATDSTEQVTNESAEGAAASPSVGDSNVAIVAARLACPLCGNRGKGNAVSKSKRTTITCTVCTFTYATSRSNLEAIGAAVALMGSN